MQTVSGYYKRSRERAEIRKSPWTALSFILAILGICASWWGTASALLTLQSLAFPSDSILSGGTEMGKALLFVPLFFPCLLLGMLFANAVLWCIPPARAGLEEKAKSGGVQNFRQAMRALLKWFIIVVLVSEVTPEGLARLKQRHPDIADDLHAVLTRVAGESTSGKDQINRFRTHESPLLKTTMGTSG